MIVRFGFKTIFLAAVLSAFGCIAVAGSQRDAGKFAQQIAPSMPATEVLENEAATVQESLTNNAATESQQTDLKTTPLNPARMVMLCVAALLLWALLASRVARLLLRWFDPWAETGLSIRERVADQRAFTDFSAAFKVGPGASPAAM